MRRLGVWGTGAVGLLMLGVVVAMAADNDEETKPTTKSNSWNPFGGWFASDAKPPAKPDSGKKTSARRPPKVDGDLEMAKYLRRQGVCLKLHEIAVNTNDSELDRMASELDKRAWELYQERTRNLPGAKVTQEKDEKRSEQRLPVGSNDTARPMPPENKPITGRDPGSTTAVREVE